MKILVTGNMGYMGPGVVRQLRASFPQATLIGFDIGYFAHCLTTTSVLPEHQVDLQYFGDVRIISEETLKGVDAVVHLAAISNDPMGKAFEEVTLEVNYKASVSLASIAKKAGVPTFVFASSCSVYGFAEEGAKTEKSEVNPLTAYARSKVFTERDLQPLADENFKVTCLRFATACGMSDRLRLDLVLNDFVAGAFTSGKISILSDGQPWRPLINVKDMALAIEWAIGRSTTEIGNYLVVNAGTQAWNYRVRELAEAVASVIPNVEIAINKEAPTDRRSYRVSFDLFKKLAPNYQPQYDLRKTIQELKYGLEALHFKDSNFRNSSLVRLNVLSLLREQRLINEHLSWRDKEKS